MRADNEIYPTAIFLLGAKGGSSSLPEIQEAHRTDYHGLHDPVLRLADMDREGISAELIYHGDFRLGDMFHNTTNRQYPMEAWEAGSRAGTAGLRTTSARHGTFPRHRHDWAMHRHACATVELEWIADKDSSATFLLAYMTHADMPPFYRRILGALLVRLRGTRFAIGRPRRIRDGARCCLPASQADLHPVAEAAGSTEQEALLAHADAVADESVTFFHDFRSPAARGGRCGR